MKKKILYIINDLDFFISHRLPIAIKAKNAGNQIYISSSPVSKNLNLIKRYNFRFLPIPITRSKKNIFLEIILFFSILRVIFKVQPDIIQLITIKPLIYGGIISRFMNIKLTIFTIAGLGYVYNNENYILKSIVLKLLRFSINQPKALIIMQNPSDKIYLKKEKVITNQRIIFTKGSGINLKEYTFKKNNTKSNIVVTLASRMIEEKGVFEFVKASQQIFEYNSKIKFLLIGKHDPESPSHIPLEILKSFNDKKKYPNLQWIGYKKNIIKYIKSSSIIVLPSYHEGVPKILLEAAACGKPIIASNIGGCREVVKNGFNGILVKKKNSIQLSKAIKKLTQNKKLLNQMSVNSRKKAILEFDISKVIDKHLKEYSRINNIIK